MSAEAPEEPEPLSEFNFDGLPGPTHNHAGLSPGNLASMEHAGGASDPRGAALQSLEKMRFVQSLGIGQALLPPQERPLLPALRRLGLTGSDAQVVAAAARGEGELLQLCSSSSGMWTANAATVAPSPDTTDGRLHLTVANLSSMFHRSLEAEGTFRALRAIFNDDARFAVHPPLPAGEAFADEGAANHTRLATREARLHLFGWGRSHFHPSAQRPSKFPARQSREASEAVARLNHLSPERTLLWQQCPDGIDDGAFHTDVLAVGNRDFLWLHERAFRDPRALLAAIQSRLGAQFSFRLVTEAELPARLAVRCYPFNSQLLSVPEGGMVLVAPHESEQNSVVREHLEKLVGEPGPVRRVHYRDVTGSMRNGGGPACLRLRVPLTAREKARIIARVFLDDDLYERLVAWVRRHYRDRLALRDLADPLLVNETRAALDELSQLLRVGSIYSFQQ